MPFEDSYLLSKELELYLKNLENKNIKILDMGSGSGIQAKTCSSLGIKKSNILCADINQETIELLKKQKFKTIHTDLFKKIKAKFDLIIFNAPYLPEDKYDRKADTTAGKRGYEIILKFLKQAKQHLNKEGAILLLFSSLSKPNIILKTAKKLDLKSKKLTEENMGFFETLFVYEFRI